LLITWTNLKTLRMQSLNNAAVRTSLEPLAPQFWKKCLAALTTFALVQPTFLGIAYATPNLITLVADTGVALSVEGSITLSSGDSLNKTGAGTMLLTADNSSTMVSGSILNITAGTVQATNANSFGSSSVVVYNGASLSIGTTVDGTGLTLANNIQIGTINGDSGTISTAGYIKLADGTTPTTLGTFPLELSGTLTQLTGSVLCNLILGGGGAITLSGDNQTSADNIKGILYIADSGTHVRLNNTKAISDGLSSIHMASGTQISSALDATVSPGLVIADDASVQFNADSSYALTVSGALSGGSSGHGAGLSLNGAGNVVLSGDNSAATYLDLTVASGTAKISAANQLPGGTLTLNGGGLETTATLSTSKAIALSANSGITVDSATTLTSTGALSGAYTATKSGAGTWVLNVDNSAAATALKVTEGTVALSIANNLPGGVFTLDGGTLETTATIADFAKAIALTANSNLSVDTATTLTTSGAVSGAYTLNLNGDGTYAINVDNSAAATSLQVSAGTLSIGAANNLPGGTFALNGGTAQLSAGFSIAKDISVSSDSTFDTNGFNTTLSGNITGSGYKFHIIGAGTATLTTATTSTADFSVDEGTLSIAASSALGTGAVYLNGGALNSTASVSISNLHMSGSSSLDIADSQLVTLDAALSGSGTLTVANANYSSEKGTLTFSTSNAASTNPITISPHAAFQVSSTLGTEFPNAAFTLNGGTLMATSDVTTSQVIDLTASSYINVASTKVLQLDSAVTGSYDIHSIGAGELCLRGTSTETSQALYIDSGTVSFAEVTQLPGNSDNAAINLAAGSTLYANLTVNADGVSSNPTFDQPLIVNGASQLKIAGSKTMKSTKSITGSGTLEVLGDASGAVLVLGNPTDATSAAPLKISANAEVQFADVTYLSSGDITLNGGQLTSTKAGSDSIGNTINVMADSSVSVGTTLEIAGPMSGSGTITKKGAGTLHILHASTNTGDYSVQEGSVQFGHLDALNGAPTIRLSDAATMYLSVDDAVYSSPIVVASGTGNIAVSNNATLSGIMNGNISVAASGKTLTLTGNSSAYSGTTTITAGTVSIAASTALQTGTVYLQNGSTLFVTASTCLSNNIICG